MEIWNRYHWFIYLSFLLRKMTKSILVKQKKRYSSWRWFLFPTIFLIRKKYWLVLYIGIIIPLLFCLIYDFYSYSLFSYISINIWWFKYILQQLALVFLFFPLPEVDQTIIIQGISITPNMIIWIFLIYNLLLRFYILIFGYKENFKHLFQKWQGLMDLMKGRKVILTIGLFLIAVFVIAHKIKDDNNYHYYLSKCKTDVTNCYSNWGDMLQIISDYTNGKISKKQFDIQYKQAQEQNDKVPDCLIKVGATDIKSCESHARYELRWYKMSLYEK